MLKGIELLLGSGSPRRKELLAMMGLKFRQITIKDVDESYPADMAAAEVAVYLSRIKADAYRSSLTEGQLLLTADTVVIIDGEIIGKPTDRADAHRILRRLSGRHHQVVTGVSLSTVDWQRSFSETTDVYFNEISEAEIDYYIDNCNPMDKAGAYGIQDWIGVTSIRKIDGCFYNVMGLPTAALYAQLGQLGLGV